MRPLSVLGATILVAALLGVLGWGLVHASAPAVQVGSAAPGLTVELLDGRPLSLDSYRGTPVVVNFWATWCADCKREAPALAAAADARPDVHFVGVLYQDAPSAARAYETVAGPYAYPIGYADDAGKAFGVTANPETFFVDSRGVVRAIQVGPLTPAQLRADLAKVTA